MEIDGCIFRQGFAEKHLPIRYFAKNSVDSLVCQHDSSIKRFLYYEFNLYFLWFISWFKPNLSTNCSINRWKLLLKQGKTLVYGGGRSGLMGVIADSALQAGGQVIGVIPRALVDRELAHPGLTKIICRRKNMHERKTKMADLSDGFIAFTRWGRYIEEIFEQWTWAQLGIHQKPCAFLNVAGFYEDLLKMIQEL